MTTRDDENQAAGATRQSDQLPEEAPAEQVSDDRSGGRRPNPEADSAAGREDGREGAGSPATGNEHDDADG